MIAVVEHRRSGWRRRPPSGARRSPRPAPARPRRTARAPPDSAAHGGDGSPRRGRRAATPSNRRGRAGSPPRADWAGAAARAAAPWRPSGPAVSAGLSAAKVTSSSGWRDIARVQEAIARLNGSFGASALPAGLRLVGFDVDRRHRSAQSVARGATPSGTFRKGRNARRRDANISDARRRRNASVAIVWLVRYLVILMRVTMKSWPIQDAKARFSEMLVACEQEGPQVVTKRGVETAVLVPIEESAPGGARWQTQPQSSAFDRRSPVRRSRHPRPRSCAASSPSDRLNVPAGHKRHFRTASIAPASERRRMVRYDPGCEPPHQRRDRRRNPSAASNP